MSIDLLLFAKIESKHSSYYGSQITMPELPEVETTLRGIQPYILNKIIKSVDVRDSRLRWPVNKNFTANVENLKITSLTRRAKYLLFENSNGFFVMHLGMSGSMRITSNKESLLKHDHIIFQLAGNKQLRFNDPRRFGCALWLGNKPYEDQLLSGLGPEPLSDEVSAEYLFKTSRKRKVAIKNFIMDNKIIVGVGNIYANEALFMSGIRPTRQAGKITRKEFDCLLENIQKVLSDAIEMGGSTLRDFVGGDGKPGYFQQTLRVYDRENEACVTCAEPIKLKVIGQRASYYCPKCQR